MVEITLPNGAIVNAANVSIAADGSMSFSDKKRGGKSKSNSNSKKDKLPGLNQSPLGHPLNVEAVEKDGIKYFKYEDASGQFGLGKRNGLYEIEDIKAAYALFEAGQVHSTNKHTGVEYVKVEGKPISRNLVENVVKAELL